MLGKELGPSLRLMDGNMLGKSLGMSLGIELGVVETGMKELGIVLG